MGDVRAVASEDNSSDHARRRLLADVSLRLSNEGGRRTPLISGYRCPCLVSQTAPIQGFDARLEFEGAPLEPGQKRRIRFDFLTREGAEAMRMSQRFFLWEGRIIGEAAVVYQEVRLLRLTGGGSSLEFDVADIADVRAALHKRVGAHQRREEHALFTVYHFAGCSLTFQNEWDDPCFISNTAEGDRMLADLYADLSSSR